MKSSLPKDAKKVQGKLSIASRMRKDPDIDRWWYQLESQSYTTPDNYCRRLNQFCKLSGVTWHDLVKMPEVEFYQLRCDVTKELEARLAPNGLPYSGEYVGAIVNTVPCNWVEFMTLKKQRYVSVRETGKKRNEVIPDSRKVELAWSAADIRGKVSISIMAYSGGCREEG